MSEVIQNTSETKLSIPSSKTLFKAAEFSIILEKPICLDYYKDSLYKADNDNFEKSENGCKLGISGEDTILYKNPEEYTSPVRKMYKIVDENNKIPDYILETQNSIYIVSGLLFEKKN